MKNDTEQTKETVVAVLTSKDGSKKVIDNRTNIKKFVRYSIYTSLILFLSYIVFK